MGSVFSKGGRADIASNFERGRRAQMGEGGFMTRAGVFDKTSPMNTGGNIFTRTGDRLSRGARRRRDLPPKIGAGKMAARGGALATRGMAAAGSALAGAGVL